jgi:hypothetical protein
MNAPTADLGRRGRGGLECAQRPKDTGDNGLATKRIRCDIFARLPHSN